MLEDMNYKQIKFIEIYRELRALEVEAIKTAV